MKKILINHIYKSWKTTVIGLIILLAALVSIFLVDNINWLDASIGIVFGLALIFAPDSLLKKLQSLVKSPNRNRCE